MSWQFDEAKNNLGEVVSRALASGPQRISHLDQVVIVISEEDFKRLPGETFTFKDYLLSGPDISELDLTRDDSPLREYEW